MISNEWNATSFSIGGRLVRKLWLLRIRASGRLYGGWGCRGVVLNREELMKNIIKNSKVKR